MMWKRSGEPGDTDATTLDCQRTGEQGGGQNGGGESDEQKKTKPEQRQELKSSPEFTDKFNASEPTGRKVRVSGEVEPVLDVPEWTTFGRSLSS